MIQSLIVIVVIFAFANLMPCEAKSDAAIFGTYSDPNHPSCPRLFLPALNSTSNVDANVFGKDSTDGEGASCGEGKDEDWGPCPAMINGDKLVVDLSSKGGPSDLQGTYANNRITWSDGNYWEKEKK